MTRFNSKLDPYLFYNVKMLFKGLPNFYFIATQEILSPSFISKLFFFFLLKISLNIHPNIINIYLIMSIKLYFIR